MTSVLFLSSTNTARSLMAEGFARARAPAGLKIASAGLAAGSVNPHAVRVMGEVGIDLSRDAAKSLQDLPPQEFDVVVALSKEAARHVAMMPGLPVLVDWGLPDPKAIEGDESFVLSSFRQSRDVLRRLVDDLFDRGYLAALISSRSCKDLVLDNISDGIIAHDMNRRIVYFNRAAERITGRKREEVMARDCHDIFPGNFCGGKCEFCDDGIPVFDLHSREIEICARNGERRHVDFAVRGMFNEHGEAVGVIGSFHDLTRERRLARRLREIESFAGIVGRDSKMLEIFDLIRDLADTSVPVLIQGESGTGKELVAAAIHNEGSRAGKQFVPVNCGALPETLLESELFGHVRGAFTGAVRDKKGRFELADGGTIFLDEIGDISPIMQVKLMRVLQEGTFERVGGETTIRVDVRLISATNKDISREIAEGRFRDDLFYRLSVVPITLPPLRERRTDIPFIADHILKQSLKELGRTGVEFSQETMAILMDHDWPGNVRELQNWIQFSLVKCKERVIRPEHLPPLPAGRPRPVALRSRHRLSESAVQEALRRTNGNRVKAAADLGVSRATLYRFLDRVAVPEDRGKNEG
jgi:PAS domain S-box-containing protein